jgi:hypothetical protein
LVLLGLAVAFGLPVAASAEEPPPDPAAAALSDALEVGGFAGWQVQRVWREGDSVRAQLEPGPGAREFEGCSLPDWAAEPGAIEVVPYDRTARSSAALASRGSVRVRRLELRWTLCALGPGAVGSRIHDDAAALLTGLVVPLAPYLTPELGRPGGSEGPSGSDSPDAALIAFFALLAVVGLAAVASRRLEGGAWVLSALGAVAGSAAVLWPVSLPLLLAVAAASALGAGLAVWTAPEGAIESLGGVGAAVALLGLAAGWLAGETGWVPGAAVALLGASAARAEWSWRSVAPLTYAAAAGAGAAGWFVDLPALTWAAAGALAGATLGRAAALRDRGAPGVTEKA